MYNFEFLCRQSCGANGIFSRRLDFSAFNSLPRTKLNSYHIKVSTRSDTIAHTIRACFVRKVRCVYRGKVRDSNTAGAEGKQEKLLHGTP